MDDSSDIPQLHPLRVIGLSDRGQSRSLSRVCPVQVHLLGALFLSRGQGQSRCFVLSVPMSVLEFVLSRNRIFSEFTF